MTFNERRKQEFLSAIDKIKSLGYEVYTPANFDKYLYAYIKSKDGKSLCYVQEDSFLGINLSTRNKPTRESGTGFRMYEMITVENITTDKIEKTLHSFPEWATKSEIKKAIENRYKSFDEFKEREERVWKFKFRQL